MGIIHRLFRKISETQWRYKFNHSNVRIAGKVEISKSAIIENSFILVGPDSFLKIGDNVKISGVSIWLYSGQLIIDDNSFLEKDRNGIVPEYILENNSTVHIGDHSRLRCQRLWSRFGSELTIGSYTNINANSEIRCDKKVSIGSFCQVSYDVRIWDTNTHNIYDIETRRNLARKYFPYMGKEVEKPSTKEVTIGDDCWLGERVSILKGSTIGNNCIVGFNTTVVGKEIEDNMCVVQQSQLHIYSKSH